MLAAWQSLWDIIWNLLVNAVTLNWAGVQAYWEDFLNWWEALWAGIVEFWETADIRIDTVRAVLLDWIWTVWDWAKAAFAEAQAYTVEQILAVTNWVLGEISGLLALIDSSVDAVKEWVTDLLASWLASALEFISPYIDAVQVWVQDTFAWVLDYYYLIVDWLLSVKAAIDWLVTEAWSQLQAFLADPIGYIGGEILGSVTEIINWWAEWGDFLVDFVTDDLAALRNLLAAGLSFLQTFVNNPLQTILDLLYPIFLDWLENLIAENW